MSFTVNHGADALAPDSLKFDIAAIQQSLDGKFSSHGSKVTFTLDANGDLVGTSADGREVLRAELSLVETTATGRHRQSCLKAVAGSSGRRVPRLPLTVTLTDKDGDRVSTDLPLIVKDGNAPVFVAGCGVSLDERGLDGSNTLTGTGHFQIDAGSGSGERGVVCRHQRKQPALTALGQSVKYELVDGDPAIPGNQILKGYVEVNGVRVEVLEVELGGQKLDNAASNGFDYKVTLYQGYTRAAATPPNCRSRSMSSTATRERGNNDDTTGTLNVSIVEGDTPTLTLTG